MTSRELPLGPIPITEPVRAILARLREARGVAPAPTVDRDAVIAVERELGSVLPDVVLALLAATGKLPAAVLEETALLHEHVTTLEPSVRATARAAVRPLVAIDHWGDWPMFSLVYRRTDDRRLDVFAHWDWKTWTQLPKSETALADFVRWRHGGIGADDAPLDLEQPPTADALRAFVPALITPAPPEERWARHPKLGIVRVVRVRDDKTEVALPDGTTKVFLTRVLEPLER